MIKFFAFALFVSLVVGIKECHRDCAEPLTAATYNTFQIPFSPDQQERLSDQIQLINQFEYLDVLCLQELWEPRLRNRLINEVKGRYPYSYFAPRFDQNCTGGCAQSEIDSVRNCIDRSNCNGNIEEQTNCFESHCSDEFDHISAQCKRCLSIGDGDIPWTDRFTNCLSGQPNDMGNTGNQNENCRFFFNGWSDNLIISRYPLRDTDFILYRETPLTAVTALYARTDVPDFGEVNVFCTHLLPASNVLFTDVFDLNIRNINEQQIEELKNWVDVKTQNQQFVVIMGDFNTGPSVGDNQGVLEDNYDNFQEEGYQNVYTASGADQCSVCSDNPFNVAQLEFKNSLIDHIFVKENLTRYCIMDSKRWATKQTAEIVEIDVPPSDHYGIWAKICGPRSQFIGEQNQHGTAAGANVSLGLATVLVITVAALLL